MTIPSRARTAIVVGALAIAITACGDDLGVPVDPDASFGQATADAGLPGDEAGQVDAGFPDAVDSVDVGVPFVAQQGTCQVSLACMEKSDCPIGFVDCANGRCIMCREDSDCAGSWHCDKATNWCHLCASDEDCTINGTTVGTGKCDPLLGQCTRCNGNDDCAHPGPANTTICASIETLFGDKTGMCVGCVTDDDCLNSPMKGCDTTTGTCSRCTSDADCCSWLQPGCSLSCNPFTGQCGCGSDQQCDDAYGSGAWKCKPAP